MALVNALAEHDRELIGRLFPCLRRKRDVTTVLDAGRIAGLQCIYGCSCPATFQGRSSCTRLTG